MPPSPVHPAHQALRIGGLQPMTTLDYPDHLACVLFCQGCAWRCRYCHNPELIRCGGPTEWSWNRVLGFLRQRQGLLQAVVFSGGEATLQRSLPDAMQRVRELGFKVGLHSAGIKPASFARALGQADWVGFDVKALEEEAALITGVTGSGQANWRSLELLLDSGVAHECRTTVHWDLLDCRRLQRLAERLAALGVRHFAVQLARPQQMLDGTLTAAATPVQAAELWPYFEQLFERFELRRG
ncbi:anaerobic ribonucleoside-triphosphate reductase activating protein [Metapseudomonas otitidis]|jgi:anaerobic ribonucleoside-triphosphate reductase activating protein|uniref:anaerobic ribonucleoside-triphosphate reductase activating protein n=1 Tax=Pseudomonadaceae TaxID=135621 RepID=UPI00244D3E77|nr:MULTISPECIES: anaerobic ribonucleoside-triphosphate reductase activating protein [Pseudomonas]MDH1105180.1 anaerobic ribonucleoside-triphosphate reductase activating protein [Pseudomonas otitidis]MDH1157445.1 anaerobic ribonucleoside-triphosphate reductase activating protein [Pseudomonas otitidis]MDH1162950.1 anaerobic ribonucleoside-triphosphate reductase activating protein [Pseudomonas otitidis]MDU9397159.1 anaerobic ribonucleoside-triphosphate reductase activating protein [Pseudomonas sp.